MSHTGRPEFRLNCLSVQGSFSKTRFNILQKKAQDVILAYNNIRGEFCLPCSESAKMLMTTARGGMSRTSPWLLKAMFTCVCQEYVEGKHNVQTWAWMNQRPTTVPQLQSRF